MLVVVVVLSPRSHGRCGDGKTLVAHTPKPKWWVFTIVVVTIVVVVVVVVEVAAVVVVVVVVVVVILVVILEEEEEEEEEANLLESYSLRYSHPRAKATSK